MDESKRMEENVIAAVRVRHHWRRPVGAALIALGACAFGVTIRTAGAFTSNLDSAMMTLEAVIAAPFGREVWPQAFAATYNAAYLGGKAIAQGSLFGMLLFTLGLVYAFGSRREDELLMRYHARLNGGEEPELD